MGMFEKDKQFGLRLDQRFDLKEQFIVWGARISDERIDTKLGPADVAIITASPMDDPSDQLDYNTVATAIVEKVRNAEPPDFPAVCHLLKVPTKWDRDALVIQFVREYSH